jgi:hypothetical protein
MSVPEPRVDRGVDDASVVALQDESEQRDHSGSTVGTGSALGIGCLVALVLFVIVAIAARWLFGAW